MKKVTLPSTLKHIQYGAFYGCTSLQTVEGLEYVQLINQSAFENCALKGTLSLNSAVAIANNAFANNTKLTKLILSETAQSIGANAFANNTSLASVEIRADLLKLGANVFRNCISLKEISINAAVIPAGAFSGCTKLENVTIGKDVTVIGEFAFQNTAVKSFTVASGNTVFFAQSNKPYLFDATGSKILLFAPAVGGEVVINEAKITTIANGAFSGNNKITAIVANGITKVEDFAFADCTALRNASFGGVSHLN